MAAKKKPTQLKSKPAASGAPGKAGITKGKNGASGPKQKKRDFQDRRFYYVPLGLHWTRKPVRFCVAKGQIEAARDILDAVVLDFGENWVAEGRRQLQQLHNAPKPHGISRVSALVELGNPGKAEEAVPPVALLAAPAVDEVAPSAGAIAYSEQEHEIEASGAPKICEAGMEKLMPEKVLGPGTFGVVYVCAVSDASSMAGLPPRVAVKQLLRHCQDPEPAIHEITVLERLRGASNCLQLLAAFSSPFSHGLVFERFDTHLRQYYKAQPCCGSNLAIIADDMLRALRVCQVRGVLHRDIKPANILLRRQPLAGYLGDFGGAIFTRGIRSNPSIGVALWVMKRLKYSRGYHTASHRTRGAWRCRFMRHLPARHPLGKSLVARCTAESSNW